MKAPFVKKIFERFTQGEKMKTIIDDFKARGIGVTIRGKRGKAKSHENPLNYNIVRRMLTNRKHIGEYKFKDIVIENGVPAIIDKNLFEKVQKKISVNKKAPAIHKAEDGYLLTTNVICANGQHKIISGQIQCKKDCRADCDSLLFISDYSK